MTPRDPAWHVQRHDPERNARVVGIDPRPLINWRGLVGGSVTAILVIGAIYGALWVLP